MEGQYDLILDCTDQPSTRYMISDLAIIAGIPLVTASALKTEGQLLVLNHPANPSSETRDEKGFCYRCVFPKPPPIDSVQSCSEAGILGPVVGVMGCLMATEAIKILTSPEPTILDGSAKKMLLYSAYNDTIFRSVRLKGKREGCPACSWPPQINREAFTTGLIDYVVFCGGDPNARYPEADLMPMKELKQQLRFNDYNVTAIVIDVCSETEFKICNVPDSENLPLSEIQRSPHTLDDYFKEYDPSYGLQLLFICRLGNDSRIAAQLANAYRSRQEQKDRLFGCHCVQIYSLEGGLKSYREIYDPEMPEY